MTAGRSLNCASCRGGWGKRSCPKSATAIHSVAVDRPSNFPIERRTLYHWATATPRRFWITKCYQVVQLNSLWGWKRLSKTSNCFANNGDDGSIYCKLKLILSYLQALNESGQIVCSSIDEYRKGRNKENW